MAVGDRSRPNSSLTYDVLLTLLPLRCAEESGVASADSGEGCKWLGMDCLVSAWSEEKETEKYERPGRGW